MTQCPKTFDNGNGPWRCQRQASPLHTAESANHYFKKEESEDGLHDETAD